MRNAPGAAAPGGFFADYVGDSLRELLRVEGRG